MTDTKSDAEVAADKAGDLLSDLLPVVGFILVYNLLRIFPGEEGTLFAKDKALYWATGVLMIGTAWAVISKKRQGKKIPPIMIITAAIVGGFGTLGIALQSPEFLYVKPTIQNLFLALLIFGGLLMGKNIWKLMFKDVFQLPDFAWRTLAIRWGLFFVAMAIWNEVLYRNFSEDTWANWKLGNMVIVFVFGALNTPYTLKHLIDDDADEASAKS